MEKAKNICTKINMVASGVLLFCFIAIFGAVITQSRYYDLAYAVLVTLPVAFVYGGTLMIGNMIEEGLAMEWDEGEELE